MNIYKLYAQIGPWATPAPAAIALAGRLYGEWVTTNYLTAWAVALFSLIALEVAGGLCSYQAIELSKQRSKRGWFWLLVLGVLVYVALGVWALWGLTAWVYIVMAVFTHIAVAADLSGDKTRKEKLEDKAILLTNRQIELQFEKEHTAQVRAQARAVKSAAQPAKPTAQPAAQRSYICDGCGREFPQQTSYAAHRRHCKVQK